MPPVCARNGSQSSLLLGTPCTYSAGATPAGEGALRQKIARPSTSVVWSLTSGTSRGYSVGFVAPPWTAPTSARVLRIRERLRCVYGIPRMAPHGHPIAELILTVLSQSTNDRNRDVAFLRLREALPTWEAVRDAPVADVEEAIRPGGISKVKSARIQAILRGI